MPLKSKFVSLIARKLEELDCLYKNKITLNLKVLNVMPDKY